MSEQGAIFELSMAGPGDLIRFAFTSGGDRDHIASLVRAYGLANYEAPTPAVFAGLIRETPGLVLDIGANTGIFTLLAAGASEVARIFAFEPLGAARQLLHVNIACNPGMAPRIIVEPLALSRVCAIVPFFETINDQGLISTSSSLELGHAIHVGTHVRREITTETLDDWAEASGEGPIRLMKIDVEGHEHAVIEGGRRTIGRYRPIIVVEILGGADFTALNGILAEDDYRDSRCRRRCCADVRTSGSIRRLESLALSRREGRRCFDGLPAPRSSLRGILMRRKEQRAAMAHLYPAPHNRRNWCHLALDTRGDC